MQWQCLGAAALLILLTGCDSVRGDAVPDAAPAVSPQPTETAELRYPAPPLEESPFSGMADGNDVWQYDIYALFGGIEPVRFADTLSLRWPEAYAQERWAPRYTLSLPQLTGEGPLSKGINTYYQGEFGRVVPELEAEQAAVGPEDACPPFSHIEEKYYYRWNDFVNVVLADYNGAARNYCDYVGDVFDRESGERLTLDGIFSDTEAEYRPALERALREAGIWYTASETVACAQEEAMLWKDETGVCPLPASGFFLLTPNGLAFPYRTGEISMMAAGSITLLLPYEAVSELLSDEMRARLCDGPAPQPPEAVYPQFSLKEVTELLELDQDGSPEADDEAWAALYRMEGGPDAALVRVTLGTGEEFTCWYPEGVGWCALSAGYLKDREKQCLVVETDVWGSNYGAADYHVFEMERSVDGYWGMAECLTLLSGYDEWDSPEELARYQSSVLRIPNPHREGNSSYSGRYLPSIIWGGGVRDLPDAPLQGLEIPTYVPAWTEESPPLHLIRWQDGGWTVEEA